LERSGTFRGHPRREFGEPIQRIGFRYWSNGFSKPDFAIISEGIFLSVGKQDNVTLQIVPYPAGAYATMSGPVILLGFDDELDPDLAYLEYAGGGETVDNQRDVQAFLDTFEDASRNQALSSEESAKLIRAALDGLKEI
jgi:hypothetical protein